MFSHLCDDDDDDGDDDDDDELFDLTKKKTGENFRDCHQSCCYTLKTVLGWN